MTTLGRAFGGQNDYARRFAKGEQEPPMCDALEKAAAMAKPNAGPTLRTILAEVIFERGEL